MEACERVIDRITGKTTRALELRRRRQAGLTQVQQCPDVADLARSRVPSESFSSRLPGEEVITFDDLERHIIPILERSVVNQLITCVQEDDQEAFDPIFEDFIGFSVLIAYRRTHNIETARDIAQHAFIKAYNAIINRTYETNRGNFKAYLSRIVTNLATDNYKDEASHPEVSLNELSKSEDENREPYELSIPSRDTDEDPMATIALRSECTAVILAAIGLLTSSQRPIMHYILAGGSLKDYSAQTGKKPTSVHSNSSRAINGLRENEAFIKYLKS